MNVPRQFSKIGMIVGAEGFEVMGRRKIGRFDMPVAREREERGCYSQPHFMVLVMPVTAFLVDKKRKSGYSVLCVLL